MRESPRAGRNPGRRFIALGTGFCMFVVVGLVYPLLMNSFPADALAALRGDPDAVFYSIDPMPGQGDPTTGFRGHKIVGEIRLTNPADREAIADRIAASAHGAWERAGCFDPRHAFHARGTSGAYDFLVCFQCGQADVYHPNGRTETIRITGSPDFFNEFLTAHGVSLPSR